MAIAARRMTRKTSVWFVLTPPVLMLDYAGPAEVLRLAASCGGPFELHHCAPSPRVATSIGTSIDGLEPLPPALPPESLVIVTGPTEIAAPGASPTFDAVTHWLKTVPKAGTRGASRAGIAPRITACSNCSRSRNPPRACATTACSWTMATF